MKDKHGEYLIVGDFFIDGDAIYQIKEDGTVVEVEIDDFGNSEEVGEPYRKTPSELSKCEKI